MELEVKEMKMLSFSSGLMWTDRSGNEKIRGTDVREMKSKRSDRGGFGRDVRGESRQEAHGRPADQRGVFRNRLGSAPFDPELPETSGRRHVAKSPGGISLDGL